MSKWNTIKERLKRRNRDFYESFIVCEEYIKSRGIQPHTVRNSRYTAPWQGVKEGPSFLLDTAINHYARILTNEAHLRKATAEKRLITTGIRDKIRRANTLAGLMNHYSRNRTLTVSLGGPFIEQTMPVGKYGNNIYIISIRSPTKYILKAHAVYGETKTTFIDMWHIHHPYKRIVGVADVQEKEDEVIGKYYVLYTAIVNMHKNKFGDGFKFYYISYKPYGKETAAFGISENFADSERQMKRAITKKMMTRPSGSK